jgi:hypothetical protein
MLIYTDLLGINCIVFCILLLVGGVYSILCLVCCDV